MKQAMVTFYYHSGFSVAVDETLLIFDYWQGEHEALPVSARIREEDLRGFKRVFVFVSHGHPDHFDEVIYTWSKDLPITYIVSDDLPIGVRGKRVKQGDSLQYDDMAVRVYGSTDLGVSFLVALGGLNIFHAGDLNLWHWREESTLRQITQAENAFYAACEPLEREKIDLCMFPLDPRMGGMFDAGANHFIMAVKPRLFIPMHWQSRAEVATEYARRGRTKYTDILPLTKPRERAELTYGEQELNIHIFTPTQEALTGLPIEENAKPAQNGVALDAYSPSDPFSNTDLPVTFKDE